MIFIDSNIPMYLVGADHPHKNEARIALERCIVEQTRLVSSAEVIQEIIHRFVSINRRDAIQPTIDALYSVVDEIFPITEDDVLEAKDLVLSYTKLSSRDALHIATMRSNGVPTIMTFDTGFDIVPKIRRVPSA